MSRSFSSSRLFQYILSSFVIIYNPFFLTSISAQSTCFSSINQLVLAEQAITDTSSIRTYVMCPNMLHSIETLDNYNRLKEDGQAMIPLRPKMVLKCGDTGRRDGEFFIGTGDLFLDGTSYYGITDDTVDGVIIQGFTFISPGRFAAEFTKPGNVVFEDCIFKDAVNATGAVLADFYNPSDMSSQLALKFHRCDFLNNRYSWENNGQAALIIGNSMQNTLIFNECKFSGNDMIFNNTNYETNSYLIESSGRIELVGNCFDNNTVGVAPVGSYNDFFASKNYGSITTSGMCAFAAQFNDPAQFESFTPECAGYDVTDLCPISSTFSPIGSPTTAPSDMPSLAPIALTSTSSTKEPSGSPTLRYGTFSTFFIFAMGTILASCL